MLTLAQVWFTQNKMDLFLKEELFTWVSNEVLFVSEFISEGDEKKQKIWVKT